MATPIEERGYANPGVLVSTEWVEQHLEDPKVRVIESNEDTLLYASGHVPGAVHVDWTTDLNDQVVRDYVTILAPSARCSASSLVVLSAASDIVQLRPQVAHRRYAGGNATPLCLRNLRDSAVSPPYSVGAACSAGRLSRGPCAWAVLAA